MGAGERLIPGRWHSIQKTFGESKLIHPVRFQIAKNSKEIDRFYKDWVLEQGAEGLVVRSDSVGTFKIKPRHSLDAAVIGFTDLSDDRQGMMHDLLLAIGRNDGSAASPVSRWRRFF